MKIFSSKIIIEEPMKHRNMRNKLWGNHTMGYNTAKKKKKKNSEWTILYATIPVTLANIVLISL